MVPFQLALNIRPSLPLIPGRETRGEMLTGLTILKAHRLKRDARYLDSVLGQIPSLLSSPARSCCAAVLLTFLLLGFLSFPGCAPVFSVLNVGLQRISQTVWAERGKRTCNCRNMKSRCSDERPFLPALLSVGAVARGCRLRDPGGCLAPPAWN